MRSIEDWRSLKTRHRKIALSASVLVKLLDRLPTIDEVAEAYTALLMGKDFPRGVPEYLFQEVKSALPKLQETGFVRTDSERVQVHYSTLEFLRKSRWDFSVPESELIVSFLRDLPLPPASTIEALQMWYGDFAVPIGDEDDFSLIGALPGDIVGFRTIIDHRDERVLAIDIDINTGRIKLIRNSTPSDNYYIPLGIVRNFNR